MACAVACNCVASGPACWRSASPFCCAPRSCSRTPANSAALSVEACSSASCWVSRCARSSLARRSSDSSAASLEAGAMWVPCRWYAVGMTTQVGHNDRSLNGRERGESGKGDSAAEFVKYDTVRDGKRW
jgi:hypothetical protein